MTRTKRRLVPSEPWGQRIDLLVKAKGWPRAEFFKHFGLSAAQVTLVRYHGARPSTAFVVQLRKLEALYQKDLEALGKGEITVDDRGHRVDWRGDGREENSGAKRPEDLQALG